MLAKLSLRRYDMGGEEGSRELLSTTKQGGEKAPRSGKKRESKCASPTVKKTHRGTEKNPSRDGRKKTGTGGKTQVVVDGAKKKSRTYNTRGGSV